MKEKVEIFIISLLVGVFCLGAIILMAGLENGNTMFSMVGGTIWGSVSIIVIIYLFPGNLKQRKREKEGRIALAEFKKRARKIKVNLEKVEITTSNWRENIKLEESNYAGLDEMAGYHKSSFQSVDRNLNILKIIIPINGKKVVFLENIEMDPTILSMHFAIKKETFLYVDKEEQYLDLEFLEK